LVVSADNATFAMSNMHRHRGLTFLELLLATALATLLMLLVLSVTAGFRQAQAHLRTSNSNQASTARLKELMEQDAAMADDIRVGPNQLLLEGFGRLNRATFQPEHGPTRVWYRLVTTNGRGYLVRQQTELDNLTNQESAVEIVLADVSNFTVEPIGNMSAATQPSTRPARPSQLRVTIDSSDPTGPGIAGMLLQVD
jgi:hypothetical protein